MKNKIKILLAFLLSLILSFAGCAKSENSSSYENLNSNKNLSSSTQNVSDDKDLKNETVEREKSSQKDSIKIDEDGEYTDKESVALYIHTYGRLPKNFITKSEAKKLGWESSKGNLFEVTGGKSIGGDRFSNREKALPYKHGEKYRECDIDYEGGRRNAKRLVYSDDKKIYYTEDHYETFQRLY